MAAAENSVDVIAKQKILVIQSFHRGQKWSDDISNSIIKEVNSWERPVELFFEYMDTKNNYDHEHLENLYRLYKYKYAKRKIDVIIATDDNALRFLIDYGFDLFSDIPVVFCGIKYFDDSLLYGHKRFTGIVESVDIYKTLDVAVKFHPSRKKMLIVVDNTTTSVSIIQSFIPVLKKMNGKVAFKFTEALTVKDLSKKLRSLGKDTIVMLANFTQDKNGVLLSIQESARLVANNCSVPVYCLWDSYLGSGVVGGCLVSAGEQGGKAAKIAHKILNGLQVSQIPVNVNNPNKYFFDYAKLKQFGIKENRLPPDSIIINEPVSVYHKYKKIIWSIAASIFGLTLIIFILSINLLARRRAEKSLKNYSEKLQFLHSIDRIILELRDIQTTAKSVLKPLRALFGCQRSSVILFDFKKGRAKVLALDTAFGTSLKTGTEYNLGDYDIARLKQGKIQIANDLSRKSNITRTDRILADVGYKSFYRIPMLAGGGLMGIISLVYTSPRELESRSIDNSSGSDKHADILHDKPPNNIIEILRNKKTWPVFWHKFQDQENLKVGKDIADTLAISIQNYKLWQQVKKHELELQGMSARIMEAQEAERKRIALELHDEMGQALTAININLSVMQNKISGFPAEGLPRRLTETIEQVENLAEQLHDLSLDLRPPMLDDLGLVPTLRWYAKVFSKRLNLNIEFTADECREIPSEYVIVLYRLTQEALNNIAKHASATRVWIRLKCLSGKLRLIVQDNGSGFDLAEALSAFGPSTGVGLLGMRERLDFLGGDLDISSKPGSGTQISAFLPMKGRVKDV
ncbi:hypothetical protein X474_10235 [Dethiosulfatarculus sandiegensis]|uniref:Oxygen sensor histidine kinase NreB n=1 Tax=Dethiosulfatarculus sandiegensis TaxID=1429043 RepID=A0A0D2J8G6_9BACT|nr:hypothetical protein X474_10235 [Dethiosulfatarculus sandiegensis]